MVRNFDRWPLLDGNVFAGHRGQVDGGPRRGHVERNAVLTRQDRHTVGADFVGGVAIGCNAVRAHDHSLNTPRLHQAGGHVVADYRGGNLVGHQLPRRQPRALQKRPRLIGINVNVFALLDRRADDAQRGSVTASRQSAGVAVGQHAAFFRQKRRAKFAHGLARGNVFLVHRVRFGQQFLLDLS